MAKKWSIQDRVLTGIEWVSRTTGYVAAGSILAMAFLIAYDVVLRYVWVRPTSFADEVSTYLLVGLIFLGAAYTLREQRHINVEVLLIRVSEKAKRWLRLLTSSISLLVFCLIARYSYDMVNTSYHIGAKSWSILGTPLYLPQMAIAIGCTVLCFQSLAEIMISIHQIAALRQERYGKGDGGSRRRERRT